MCWMMINIKLSAELPTLFFYPVTNLLLWLCPTLPVPRFFSSITQLARSKVLPASTKITLLSLSCSNQRHNQDNHNNQKSISLLRHYFCVAEQDRIGSASSSSSAEIVGDRAPHCQRGCNWLPPSAPAERSLHLALLPLHTSSSHPAFQHLVKMPSTFLKEHPNNKPQHYNSPSPTSDQDVVASD